MTLKELVTEAQAILDKYPEAGDLEVLYDYGSPDRPATPGGFMQGNGYVALLSNKPTNKKAVYTYTGGR